MLHIALIPAALAALIYHLRHAGRPEGHATWEGSLVKTAATALLVVTGLGLDAPSLILLGLALGSLGDFLLSRPGRAAFLGGMAAFAAGHVAYALALWWRAQDLGFAQPGYGLAFALAVLAAFVLALALWLAAKAGPLRVPVFGYALVIGSMAATAVILPANTGDRVIQFGVALFLISDVLLAIRLFVAEHPATRRQLGLAVWPAYWIGQLLILYGAALYWAFPKC